MPTDVMTIAKWFIKKNLEFRKNRKMYYKTF